MPDEVKLVERVARAIREEQVRQYRDGERSKCPAGTAFYEEQVGPYKLALAAIEATRPTAATDDVVKELVEALTDARNNILSLLGGFRDDMPDVAVKLFQAQAKQIDAALAPHWSYPEWLRDVFWSSSRHS